MARDVTMTLEIRGVPDTKLDQEVIDAVEERMDASGMGRQAPWTDWEAKIVRGMVRINQSSAVNGRPRR
jgi:hypothetical protein